MVYIFLIFFFSFLWSVCVLFSVSFFFPFFHTKPLDGKKQTERKFLSNVHGKSRKISTSLSDLRMRLVKCSNSHINIACALSSSRIYAHFSRERELLWYLCFANTFSSLFTSFMLAVEEFMYIFEHQNIIFNDYVMLTDIFLCKHFVVILYRLYGHLSSSTLCRKIRKIYEKHVRKCCEILHLRIIN